MDGIEQKAAPAICHEWWQTGIIYQIYPRSFADGNGDGGRRPQGYPQAGSTTCRGLGVDCVWLSPIYPSPMPDFGLRRVRLHRHPPAVRRPGRLRRPARRRPRPWHEADPRLRAQPLVRPAPVVHRGPVIAGQSEARLVYLARPAPPAAGHRTTGSAPSAGPPGNWTPPPANIFSTPSWPNSPT